MRRIIAASLLCAYFLVLCGCKHPTTKVVEEHGKVTSVEVKGFVSPLNVETVEIEGVEYLIFYDNVKHFSVCPKVNGKHAK
jgi:hypothetical protein